MRTKLKTHTKRSRKRKLGHVPISANGRRHAGMGLVPISDEIVYLPLADIRPSPQNDQLYKPVDTSSPDFEAFAENIRINGIRDPLIITREGYIASGHRRYAAAKIVGLKTVPCRIADIDHDDPRFLSFLRDMNRQRVKTLDEILREEVVSADPEEAHRLLREYRERMARVDVDTIALGARKKRARITRAKQPLLDAICDIVAENEGIGKLSVRQIFYLLLNVTPPPLVHAGKADSAYRNSLKCYKAVDDLCVRARLAGRYPLTLSTIPRGRSSIGTCLPSRHPSFARSSMGS